MNRTEKEFRISLGLIRFWRHQRRDCARFLKGQTLRDYQEKCTKEVKHYIQQAKELKTQLAAIALVTVLLQACSPLY